MNSIESSQRGYLLKKQKLLSIGSVLGIDNIKNVIIKMYLSGMSANEIAEDFNSRLNGISITARAITKEIQKQSKLNGVSYIRNKKESYKNAINRGRRTYKIKENKYKRIGLSLGVRYKVLERDGFKCVACGGNYQLEIDHNIPICHGGTNNMDNLRTLCWYCNNGKAQSEK